MEKMFKYAINLVLRRKFRTALTSLGIMLAVMLMSFILFGMTDLKNVMLSEIETRFNPLDLYVSGQDNMSFGGMAVAPTKFAALTVSTWAVASPSTLRTLMTSTPDTEAAGKVTTASSEAVMFKVSVPAPPVIESTTENVPVAAPSYVPLMVSLPEVPATVSRPVVSVIASYSAIPLKVKDLRAF